MELTLPTSPLETLVVVELDRLRTEQARLAETLPALAVQSDGSRHQFLDAMVTIRQRTARLERMLEAMAGCGFRSEASTAQIPAALPTPEQPSGFTFLEAS